MKKLILLAVSLALTVTVSAQPSQPPPPTNAPPVTSTNLITGPAKDAWNFLTATGSNWMVAPYGIYDSGNKEWGGGLAVAYKLSDFVVPTMRFDYLHKEIWMPSADLQLQLPLTIAGKVTLIPFAFAGIATPISGQGNDNGSAVGMFGAGGALRVGSRWDLVFDVESWQGAHFDGLQYRFGVLYKF